MKGIVSRRWMPWLLKGAGLAILTILLSNTTQQGERSRASVAAAAPVPEVNAKRITLSESDAKQLALYQPAGERIRSLLNVRKRLTYGEFVWDDSDVAPGDVWIRIDLANQLMSVFRGGHEIGTAVIMYGGDGKPTPAGQFSVLWKKADHRSSLYDATMPYTLRLTGDGIAIHGADVRAQYATNGCVSVPLKFAELLFGQAAVGTPVTILHEAPSSKGGESA